MRIMLQTGNRTPNKTNAIVPAISARSVAAIICRMLRSPVPELLLLCDVLARELRP
jgi:hypothetical protein